MVLVTCCACIKYTWRKDTKKVHKSAKIKSIDEGCGAKRGHQVAGCRDRVPKRFQTSTSFIIDSKQGSFHEKLLMIEICSF